MLRKACGVTKGMWCYERHVVSRKACGVTQGMWCHERHVVLGKACGVTQGMWCHERHVVLGKACGLIGNWDAGVTQRHVVLRKLPLVKSRIGYVVSRKDFSILIAKAM